MTPFINTLKHPKEGRKWELYEEDPFLTGELAEAVVKLCKVMNTNIPEEALLKFILNLFIKQLKKVM